MDDATALRLRKIELNHRSAERSASLQSQLRIAVLVVAATFGVSAAFAGWAKQVQPDVAGAFTVASAVAIGIQVRG